MKILLLVISFFTLSFTPIYDIEDHQHSELEVDIKGNKSFAKFLSHFEKVDIPEDIDHQKLQEYKSTFLETRKSSLVSANNAKTDVKNFLSEAVGSKFSRMGPPLVIPLDRYYPDENTIAVIYLVRYHFELSGFDVKLALFDLKGNNKMRPPNAKSKKINSMLIAGFNIDETVMCTFENPSSIFKITMKNNWQKELSEHGIKDNSIANYERLNSDLYTIQSNGKIEVDVNPTEYVSIK